MTFNVIWGMILCIGLQGWYLKKITGVKDDRTHDPSREVVEGNRALTAFMLTLDALITASHILLPIRWSVLIVLEVACLFIFLVPTCL